LILSISSIQSTNNQYSSNGEQDLRNEKKEIYKCNFDTGAFSKPCPDAKVQNIGGLTGVLSLAIVFGSSLRISDVTSIGLFYILRSYL
jgi:hypothetical protein